MKTRNARKFLDCHGQLAHLPYRREGRRRLEILIAVLVLTTAPFAHAATHYQLLLLFSDVGNHINVTGASLCYASDGVLYGTTDTGTNAGTVFKVNRDGSGYRVLYNFTGTNGDGARPSMGVTEGSDGALYGTTMIGGILDRGTVFKINKDGSGYQVIHRFAGSPNDAQSPGTSPGAENELLQGSDGAIYGITRVGGSFSLGTAYRLNHDGSGYSVIYSFGKPADGFHDYGSYPSGGLIEGSDGVLYGTASNGGLGDTKGGDGVVFRMNKDGSAYTILHNFSQATGDAYAPASTLLEASDGALYGTTDAFTGNNSNPSGALFTIHKDGNGYAILHTFEPGEGTESDSHRLLEGRDGRLYGTTQRGGSNGMGVIYMLNKDGSAYTVLHTFPSGSSDGIFPGSGLVQGQDNLFYGATPKGGSGPLGINDGVIFKLWPPETPDMMGTVPSANGVQVTFAGMATNQYRLFRSLDLSNWSVLTNVTMPAAGTLTHSDRSASATQAFYRAAWLP